VDAGEEGAGAGGVSGELVPAHAFAEGGPAGVGVDGFQAWVGGEAEDFLGAFAVAGFDGGEGLAEVTEGGGEQECGGGGECLVADLLGEFGVEGFGGLAVPFAEFQPGVVGAEDAWVEVGAPEMDLGVVEAA